MVLGLTGKCCAGKDEAAAILRARGWEVIDVDALGHEALELRREELIEEFGPGILRDGGSIDRRSLGILVFSDEEALRRLESIVHPEMKRMVAERIRDGGAAKGVRVAGGEPRLCINAALLFHMGLHEFCDRVILVKAPLPLRCIRAARRDGFRPLFLLRRFLNQRSLFPKLMTYAVDMYTVRNCGSRMRLEVAIMRTLLGETDEKR